MKHVQENGLYVMAGNTRLEIDFSSRGAILLPGKCLGVHLYITFY
jgi:hypothetical protein